MKNTKLIQKTMGVLFAVALGTSSATMATDYYQNNQSNAEQITRIFGAHINQYPLLPTDNEVRRCWENTREDYTRKNKIDPDTINNMKQKLTLCWKNNGHFGKQQNYR
ncbi:MAG: hypothetical protein V4525_12365 [Pseudomonadota bacterium]